jgi:hypothetical protein
VVDRRVYLESRCKFAICGKPVVDKRTGAKKTSRRKEIKT